MKIYLILEYKKDGEHVWADVKAFTSPKQRNIAFHALPKDIDAEAADIEVAKRSYNKKVA